MALSALPALNKAAHEQFDRELAARSGPVPLLLRAGLHLDRGDAAAAADLARQAWGLDPRMADLGILFQRLGQPAPDTAADAFVMERAGALLAAGFYASPLVERLLLAAGRLGAVDQVTRWMDYQRFLWIGALNPPDSLLNAALADAMATDLVPYTDEDPYLAFRQVWRRDGLAPGMGDPVLDDMFERLHPLVADWIAALPDEPDHAFLAAKPERFRLGGWSVVSGAASHHISHIHPQCWANLVIYAQTPPVIHASRGHQGWLRLGPPAEWGLDERHGLPDVWIEPRPGMVVIMPSYFSHESIPLGVDGRRVCAAIQIYPAL
jgi:hypothetical protein